jgi:hypothetical protein
VISPAEPVIIRRLTAADRAAWCAMRVALYREADPDTDTADLEAEIDQMLGRDDWAAFAAQARDGTLTGLIELFERNYAQGCASSPVCSIEGLWVAEGWRRPAWREDWWMPESAGPGRAGAPRWRRTCSFPT